MIQAIIVEDEEKSCEVLKKMLTEYCADIVVTGVANNIHDAKKLIELKHPELIFLDIQLPDGISFLLIDEIHPVDFKIIFTTAYSDYAIKALKCAALDYLLKPININELVAAVDKYKIHKTSTTYLKGLVTLQENISHFEKEKLKTIGLATLNEILFVPIDDIIRLEAASNYTHFYIENSSKVTVSHTLKYYEDLLENNYFMRVHQSHIINLKKVKKYIKGKTGTVIMNDGQNIDISPKKKDVFLKALNWL